MKIYAVKVYNVYEDFNYEHEAIDFCATKEVAFKVLEERKKDYEEFEGIKLYVEEISVRES